MRCFGKQDKLQSKYSPNIVRNQKYNVFTFLPIVFYEQFKFFFNLYFLLVALSQFIPALRTGEPSSFLLLLLSVDLTTPFHRFTHSSPGFLVTYIAPLAFVLLVTMGKEAYDDYKRNLRDREANSARYLVLASRSSSSSPSNDDDELSHSLLEDNLPPTRSVPSSSIRVGDLVLLEKNQRVPADLVLLRTSDTSGTCFIRTDQLDGETDWKLRVAVQATQKLPSDQELLNLDAEIYGESSKTCSFSLFSLPMLLLS
jgi:phospholipid-translocating ATPase